MTREEIIEALSKLGDNGHNGIDFDEWQAINAAIECLRTDGLWHPANELPVIPEGKNWVKVVALVDYGDNTLRPRHEIYKDKGWSKEDMWTIVWWCYPPKQE